MCQLWQYKKTQMMLSAQVSDAKKPLLEKNKTIFLSVYKGDGRLLKQNHLDSDTLFSIKFCTLHKFSSVPDR